MSVKPQEHYINKPLNPEERGGLQEKNSEQGSW